MRSPTADSQVAEIAVTSIKVERAKLEQLRKVAQGEHRSVSQQLRFLIDQCIAEAKDEAA